MASLAPSSSNLALKWLVLLVGHPNPQVNRVKPYNLQLTIFHFFISILTSVGTIVNSSRRKSLDC